MEGEVSIETSGTVDDEGGVGWCCVDDVRGVEDGVVVVVADETGSVGCDGGFYVFCFWSEF